MPDIAQCCLVDKTFRPRWNGKKGHNRPHLPNSPFGIILALSNYVSGNIFLLSSGWIFIAVNIAENGPRLSALFCLFLVWYTSAIRQTKREMFSSSHRHVRNWFTSATSSKKKMPWQGREVLSAICLIPRVYKFLRHISFFLSFFPSDAPLRFFYRATFLFKYFSNTSTNTAVEFRLLFFALLAAWHEKERWRWNEGVEGLQSKSYLGDFHQF